jgi:hypothetical protein
MWELLGARKMAQAQSVAAVTRLDIVRSAKSVVPDGLET